MFLRRLHAIEYSVGHYLRELLDWLLLEAIEDLTKGFYFDVCW